MERIIKIIDNGLPRYILNPNHIILGKMYDNESEELVIERPLIEQDSICTLIIADINGKVIDNIDMTTNRYKIRSNLSQYPRIQFAFSFSRPDGYIKNSDTAFGDFGFALKPDGFIPVEPKDKENFNYIVGNAFTDSRLNGNTLEFYNMNGNKVISFDLSPFTQEQVDLGEPDSTKETFVKGKKTSNLVNDGEDGTSPYATKKFVLDNIGTSGVTQEYVDNAVGNEAVTRENADTDLQNQINDIENNKLDKIATTAGYDRVYVVTYNGIQTVKPISPSALGGYLMLRDSQGKSKVTTPIETDDEKTIVNIEYLNNAINSAITTVLNTEV